MPRGPNVAYCPPCDLLVRACLLGHPHVLHGATERHLRRLRLPVLGQRAMKRAPWVAILTAAAALVSLVAAIDCIRSERKPRAMRAEWRASRLEIYYDCGLMDRCGWTP